MLALGPKASADTLLDVSSSLSLSDPTQLGRLSRDGIISDWSSAKAFPGAFNTTLSYHYHTFSLFSRTLAGTTILTELTCRYVQVLVEDTNSAIFVSAYLDSYTPDPTMPNRGLDVNYLGDLGNRGGFYGVDPASFQVFVPAGHDLILVVSDTGVGNAGIGKPFRVLVEGFTDTQYSDTRPAIVNVAMSNTNLVLNATNGIAGRTYDVLTSTNLALPLSQWAPIATNVPNASGSFLLTVTSAVNPLDRQRFFILQSPAD